MNSPIFIAQLDKVTKYYRGNREDTPAVNDVSFSTSVGEMVLVKGPSGSGKTTLLTLLSGLQKPSEGEVYLFGKRVTEYSAKELQAIRATQIGYIFQTFLLLDSLNVMDNVVLVTRFAGIRKKEAYSRASQLLEKFGVLHLANAFPKTLSQGEKQRVAVARALVNDAKFILADEPTGSLATSQGMEIVRFLQDSVKNEDRCAVIASHDDRITSFVDRVVTLKDGRIV